jgi:hypothetical protein
MLVFLFCMFDYSAYCIDLDVEQVAEAYMLKRDHPKFKGN